MSQRTVPALFLALGLALYLPAAAQPSKDDSARQRRDYMAQQAALRYPALRLAMVELETLGGTHYTSTLKGKDYLSGTVRPESNLKATVNIPVYTGRKQEVSVIAVYHQQVNTLTNTVTKIPQYPVSDGEYDMQNLSLALNYKRKDSLFSRPILWGGTALTHISLQSAYSRTVGLVYGIIPLKTTPTTRIMAGLVVTIDPSSLFPVIPTFSYWHKFAASPWEISIDLPTRALLRRPAFSKGLLSFGTELAQNLLLRKIDEPPYQGGYAVRDLELKNGFTLEYPIARKVLIGCSGGFLYTPQYRIEDPAKSNSNYLIGINRHPGPYFNLSLSLLR